MMIILETKVMLGEISLVFLCYFVWFSLMPV